MTIDRAALAYPADTEGWVGHLDRLAHEVRRRGLNSTVLAIALARVFAAVEDRRTRTRNVPW